MKKNILIVCLTIIALTLATLVFLVYTGKVDLKKSDNQPIENNMRTITRKYEVTMNGNKKIISVEFEVQKDSNDEDLMSVLGKYNGEIVYNGYQRQSNFEVAVDESFKKSDIAIIKGDDSKDYLVIRTMVWDQIGFLSEFKIFNQNDNMINKVLLYFSEETVSFKDKVNHWYNDKYDICKYDEPNCQVRAKIENNKIYSLEEIDCANENEGLDGYFNEYIYTINNNSLIKSDAINTYITSSVAGNCSNNY